MEWGEILGILGGVFSGIVVMLAVAVHLEQWLAAGLEQPKLTAVPPVLGIPVLETDELELGDQGAA